MDSILVTEPVGTLDGIVHVPSPVIFVHVSEGSVDSTLRGNSVTSGREEFRDTGRVEASLGKTESRAETGTASANDEGIVFVVLRVWISRTRSRDIAFEFDVQ